VRKCVCPSFIPWVCECLCFIIEMWELLGVTLCSPLKNSLNFTVNFFFIHPPIIVWTSLTSSWFLQQPMGSEGRDFLSGLDMWHAHARTVFFFSVFLHSRLGWKNVCETVPGCNSYLFFFLWEAVKKSVLASNLVHHDGFVVH